MLTSGVARGDGRGGGGRGRAGGGGGRGGEKERNISPGEGDKLEGRVVEKRGSDHAEPSFSKQIAIKMEACEGVVAPIFFFQKS